ncbi:hypothetical protein Celaphus_00002133 [Cervus elaphus hippelaphus]|uniref:Uncharacterized protein n=1 Tax=Cervus elaphus hippelaphus TaxID=46360 RepID=A0A212CGZ1_CEREH|nr:hypothetical protein Celaphus_00002133 [Cervus elaphus hippelaphus]
MSRNSEDSSLPGTIHEYLEREGGPCCLSWLAKRKPPYCPWLPLLLSPAARPGEAGYPFQGQRGTRC